MRKLSCSLLQEAGGEKIIACAGFSSSRARSSREKVVRKHQTSLFVKQQVPSSELLIPLRQQKNFMLTTTMITPSQPINVATVYASSSNGNFVVRCNKELCSFDFFEDAFNFLSQKGYARMCREEEKDWVSLFLRAAEKVGKVPSGSDLLLVMGRPITSEQFPVPSVSSSEMDPKKIQKEEEAVAPAKSVSMMKEPPVVAPPAVVAPAKKPPPVPPQQKTVHSSPRSSQHGNRHVPASLQLPVKKPPKEITTMQVASNLDDEPKSSIVLEPMIEDDPKTPMDQMAGDPPDTSNGPPSLPRHSRGRDPSIEDEKKLEGAAVARNNQVAALPNLAQTGKKSKDRLKKAQSANELRNGKPDPSIRGGEFRRSLPTPISSSRNNNNKVPRVALPYMKGFHPSMNGESGLSATDVYDINENAIGKGGFGYVFQATHNSANDTAHPYDNTNPNIPEWRAVAVKETVPTRLDTKNTHGKLVTYHDVKKHSLEVQALLKLRTPEASKRGLLYLHEYFWNYEASTGAMSLTLVTELLGQSLDQWARLDNVRTEDAVRAITGQLVGTLDYMHSQKVVHRGLKLQDVLFKEAGNFESLKIVDFTYSKILEDNERTSTFCGNVGYLAPEMYRGEPYGKEVDMFALGCMIFRLLSGERPFNYRHKDKVREATVNLKYSFQSKTWALVSEEAKDFVKQLLASRDKRITAVQANYYRNVPPLDRNDREALWLRPPGSLSQ